MCNAAQGGEVVCKCMDIRGLGVAWATPGMCGGFLLPSAHDEPGSWPGVSKGRSSEMG
jgi:hypothetical protein